MPPEDLIQRNLSRGKGSPPGGEVRSGFALRLGLEALLSFVQTLATRNLGAAAGGSRLSGRGVTNHGGRNSQPHSEISK